MNINNTTAQEKDSTSNMIIRMEKSALERWDNGDLSGFLEISSEDVVCFDPSLEKRLDGLDKLTIISGPLGTSDEKDCFSHESL